MKMSTVFWEEILNGRDRLENLGTSEVILKLILRKQGGSLCTSFVCVRIKTEVNTVVKLRVT